MDFIRPLNDVTARRIITGAVRTRHSWQRPGPRPPGV